MLSSTTRRSGGPPLGRSFSIAEASESFAPSKDSAVWPQSLSISHCIPNNEEYRHWTDLAVSFTHLVPLRAEYKYRAKNHPQVLRLIARLAA